VGWGEGRGSEGGWRCGDAWRMTAQAPKDCQRHAADAGDGGGTGSGPVKQFQDSWQMASLSLGLCHGSSCACWLVAAPAMPAAVDWRCHAMPMRAGGAGAADGRVSDEGLGSGRKKKGKKGLLEKSESHVPCVALPCEGSEGGERGAVSSSKHAHPCIPGTERTCTSDLSRDPSRTSDASTHRGGSGINPTPPAAPNQAFVAPSSAQWGRRCRARSCCATGTPPAPAAGGRALLCQEA
jgi:hypothetical protein